MKRKKTLRRMPPVTRKLHRLINELESVSARLRNLAEEVHTQEFTAIALQRAVKAWEERGASTGEVPEEQLDLLPEEDTGPAAPPAAGQDLTDPRD